MIIEKDKLLLAQYLSEIKFKEYSLGDFDCVLFVADWIDRLTGVNWTKDIRGKYNNKRGAFRLAKNNNLPSMMVGKFRPDKWDNPGYKEISRDELPATGDIWWNFNNKTHYTGFIIFQGFAWCSLENGISKHLPEEADLDNSPGGHAKRFRRI